MTENNFTLTPNVIFDCLLKELSSSELKIVLVIIRQTIGWVDQRTGKRKERDRISISQFVEKTGLSRRSISLAINSLSERGLIVITDKRGSILSVSNQRKGQFCIYYSFSNLQNDTCAKIAQDMSKKRHQLEQKVTYNKRNYNKRNSSKENLIEYELIKDITELKKSELKSKLKHIDDSSELINSDESKKLS